MAGTPKQKYFQRRLAGWYRKHRRALPWRTTKNPYHILVSEVMLQQTQVDRVLPKYRDFLRAFPTMRRLARAPRSAVIQHWAGLGYNSRAVRLQRAVQEIVTKHKGRFPSSLAELESLPGVGHYTARAVATFAFGERVPAIDTNHTRVLGRYFFGVQGGTEKQIQKVGERVLPRRDPASWNHALMDFGALVCKSRPRCEECPLQSQCRAYPKVLTTIRKPKKMTERFFGSNRFLRGQIIDALRALPEGSSCTLASLFSSVAVPGLTPHRMTVLIDSLAQAGLLTIEQRKAALYVRLG